MYKVQISSLTTIKLSTTKKKKKFFLINSVINIFIYNVKNLIWPWYQGFKGGATLMARDSNQPLGKNLYNIFFLKKIKKWPSYNKNLHNLTLNLIFLSTAKFSF